MPLHDALRDCQADAGAFEFAIRKHGRRGKPRPSFLEFDNKIHHLRSAIVQGMAPVCTNSFALCKQAIPGLRRFSAGKWPPGLKFFDGRPIIMDESSRIGWAGGSVVWRRIKRDKTWIDCIMNLLC